MSKLAVAAGLIAVVLAFVAGLFLGLRTASSLGKERVIYIDVEHKVPIKPVLMHAEPATKLPGLGEKRYGPIIVKYTATDKATYIAVFYNCSETYFISELKVVAEKENLEVVYVDNLYISGFGFLGDGFISSKTSIEVYAVINSTTYRDSFTPAERKLSPTPSIFYTVSPVLATPEGNLVSIVLYSDFNTPLKVESFEVTGLNVDKYVAPSVIPPGGLGEIVVYLKENATSTLMVFSALLSGDDKYFVVVGVVKVPSP